MNLIQLLMALIRFLLGNQRLGHLFDVFSRPDFWDFAHINRWPRP